MKSDERQRDMEVGGRGGRGGTCRTETGVGGLKEVRTAIRESEAL